MHSNWMQDDSVFYHPKTLKYQECKNLKKVTVRRHWQIKECMGVRCTSISLAVFLTIKTHCNAN